MLEQDPEKTTITFGYEAVFLVCKQISDEFSRVERASETLRCHVEERKWPWRLQKSIDQTLRVSLNLLLDSIRVLKTSMVPDESSLWYIVDLLPVLQELHVRLPDQDIDYSLKGKSLNHSTQERLKSLTVPYFQPSPYAIWFLASMFFSPYGPASSDRRALLDEKAYQILKEQVNKGLKVFSHVDLYTLPVCCKEIVIKNDQKLRHKWNVVLDGVSGTVVSKELGDLCWRDLSYSEKMTQKFENRHRRRQNAQTDLIDAMESSVIIPDDDCTELSPPKYSIKERYLNLIDRRKAQAKGGSKQAVRQMTGKLTFSKDRNTQARML